jgi:adenylosuccinate synthase
MGGADPVRVNTWAIVVARLSLLVGGILAGHTIIAEGRLLKLHLVPSASCARASRA